MKRIVCNSLLMLAMICLFAEPITNIRTAHDISYGGAKASLPDGSNVVVYLDTAQGTHDVYAQRFSAAGEPLWQSALCVANKPAPMQSPDVVVSSDGSFIVAWVEEYGMLTRVYAQKLDSLGLALWQPGGVQVFGELGISSFLMVPNSTGGAYILANSMSQDYWNNLWGANLGSDGQNLWQAGGQSILSFNGRVYIDNALSDGAGGVIVQAIKYSNNQAFGHIFRLGANGNYVGSNPLFPESGVNYNSFRIRRCLDGSFLLFNQLYPSGNLHFNKVDNLGNSLLPQPVEYAYNGDISLFAESPDGSFYLGWQSWNGDDSFFYAQKFNTALQQVWPAFTTQYIGPVNYIYGDMQCDAQGNLWYAWSANYTAPNFKLIRVQKFDASGNPTLGENGLQLCNKSGREQPVLMRTATNMLALWTDLVDQHISLRRQLISPQGTLLLPPQGEVLAWHLYGAAQLQANLSLPDGWMQLWNDYREIPYSSVYYQKTNLQHAQLYEADGRLLAPGRILEAAANSLGEVLIAYTSNETTGETFYLQLIGVSGQPVYPGNGLLISPDADNVNISAQDADFYLFWRENPNPGTSQIMGQRISNGQLMWEPDGKLIKSFTGSDYIGQQELTGSYYIWDEGFVKVLRFEPDGSISPGWNAQGNGVAAGPSGQDIGKTGLINGNLAIVVLGQVIRAQLMTPQGNWLWGGGVQMISGMSGDRDYANADIKDGISATFYNYNSGNNTYTLYLQRINPNGELEYDITGLQLGTGDFQIVDSPLIDHGTGEKTILIPSMTIAYEDYRIYDLIPYHVTATGVVETGVPLGVCLKNEFNLLAALHPDETMLAWNQLNYYFDSGYSGYYAFSSVSACYLDIQTTELDEDITLPQPVLSKLASYPNPFAQSTTISFKLGSPGNVELSIYNLKGQLVKSSVFDAEKTTEPMQIHWDGKDDKGKTMPTGVYLYTVQSKGVKLSGKMLRIK